MNIINDSNVGIVSYGTYIPIFRITVEEIAKTWKSDPVSVSQGLGLIEKSVPGLDEDTATVSVNASIQAYTRAQKSLSRKHIKIGAIYAGSESHPYAVKPTSGIVGEALELNGDYTAADLEFACKAGTAGVQAAIGLVESNRIDFGLGIGADTSQGAPGDALEYSAACAGAAFIVGKENIIAKLIHTTSYTTDTPDFWRREHEHFPKHGGRFTGEPAYFKHVGGATKKILLETNSSISDFEHVIFHMPNGKFPKVIGKVLGVSDEQLKAGFVVPYLGNSYSGSSLMGFAAVLDKANVGEKILLVSYGSGSGSDAFIFEVTEQINNYRERISALQFDLNVENQMKRKVYLSYGEYVRHSKKLIS